MSSNKVCAVLCVGCGGEREVNNIRYQKEGSSCSPELAKWEGGSNVGPTWNEEQRPQSKKQEGKRNRKERGVSHVGIPFDLFDFNQRCFFFYCSSLVIVLLLLLRLFLFVLFIFILLTTVALSSPSVPLFISFLLLLLHLRLGRAADIKSGECQFAQTTSIAHITSINTRLGRSNFPQPLLTTTNQSQ